MEMKNCIRCKKVFCASSRSKLCSVCLEEDEEDFKKIKEFLNENKDANITKVSEATGITFKKIQKFIREGRIELQEGSKDSQSCDICGVSIDTGRFCKKCIKTIQKKIESNVSKPDAKEYDGPKFRSKISKR